MRPTPRQKSRFSPLVAAACVVVAACAVTIAAQGASLSYELPHRLTLHEPVILDVQLQNLLLRPVDVAFGKNYVGAFTIDIVSPDGRTTHVDPARPRAPDELSVRGDITLNPGATYSNQLVLNEWFPFGTTGSYQITIKFSGTIKTADGARVDVPRGESKDLYVAAQSDQQLRQACSRLLRVAQSADWSVPWGGARQAAVALSYVDDPIAVEYLRALIGTDLMGDQIAIKGLVRIGSVEAERVLDTETKSPDARIAERAAIGLRDLRLKRKSGG